MQCFCECGALMANVEKGFDSECVCAQCFSRCDICLGTNSVMSKDQIKSASFEEEAP